MNSLTITRRSPRPIPVDTPVHFVVRQRRAGTIPALVPTQFEGRAFVPRSTPEIFNSEGDGLSGRHGGPGSWQRTTSRKWTNWVDWESRWRGAANTGLDHPLANCACDQLALTSPSSFFGWPTIDSCVFATILRAIQTGGYDLVRQCISVPTHPPCRSTKCEQITVPHWARMLPSRQIQTCL
jgi:hypothetical protein